MRDPTVTAGVKLVEEMRSVSCSANLDEGEGGTLAAETGTWREEARTRLRGSLHDAAAAAAEEADCGPCQSN